MIEEKSERLGAHEVAAFLRRHPKFLSQFPDLALTLVVPKEEGKASSLASYQLDVLRDKNRELTRRLHDLFANAQENERLAVRTHQLSLALTLERVGPSPVRALVSGVCVSPSREVRAWLADFAVALDPALTPLADSGSLT